MLRVDNNAQIVLLPWSFPRMFSGRYAVQSRRQLFAPRWGRPQIDGINATQGQDPVVMVRVDRRVLWYFMDAFYWDDEDLSADDVRALVLQRQRRRSRQLQTAHSLMRAEEAGRPLRAPIPADLRRAVYERDAGQCIECGSAFNLQYDHVLPVALGGATTIENLQLLCADCNQRKSDSP